LLRCWNDAAVRTVCAAYFARNPHLIELHIPHVGNWDFPKALVSFIHKFTLLARGSTDQQAIRRCRTGAERILDLGPNAPAERLGAYILRFPSAIEQLYGIARLRRRLLIGDGVSLIEERDGRALANSLGEVKGIPIGKPDAAMRLGLADLLRSGRPMDSITRLG
jgi:hypothetical protein